MLFNQEKMQQKKGAWKACRSLFYSLITFLSIISSIQCQLEEKNTTHSLTLHNLQFITPHFPNMNYFQNVLSKEAEFLWSSDINSHTILAILYSSVTKFNNMPVNAMCKKLKYSMTSQSTLDVLYWGMITAKQLSCPFKLPKSTLALLQSTLNSTLGNAIIIDSLALKEHEKTTHTLSQIRLHSNSHISWMFSYKMLCILKLATNSDTFDFFLERFKTQLSHEIFQAFEKKQIQDSVSFLQLLHVYFSLNLNSLDQEHMVHFHRSISQNLNQNNIALLPFNLQTGLHVAFLDSVARYFNEPSPWTLILSNYLEISLRKALDSPRTFSDLSQNLFFLLALSNRSIQRVLLPLSSPEIPFHVMIVYGSLHECSQFFQTNASLQSSLCLQLSYCHPCNENQSCSNKISFTSPETLHVSFVSDAHKLVTVPFLKEINSLVGVPPNPHQVRCPVSNLYDLSNLQTKGLMEALVLRFSENSKDSVSIIQPKKYLNTSFSSFFKMTTHKKITVTTEMMNSTRKIDLQHTIVNLPLEMTSNLYVQISLYENPGMGSLQHFFQRNRSTLIGSFNEPIQSLQVVLLVEALEDPTLPSLVFSTPQYAARFRPQSSLSAVQLYHPVALVTDHTTYTFSLPLSKLITDMNLLPTTLLKLTALIVSHSDEYVSSQHVIGTFNVSQSDYRMFLTPVSKAPVLVETLNHSFYTIPVDEAFWHPKPLNFQVSPTLISQERFSMITLGTLMSIAVMTLLIVYRILCLFTLKKDFRCPTFWETIFLIYCLFMAVFLTLYKFYWTFLFFLEKCIPLVFLGIFLSYISCTRKTLQECCRPTESILEADKNE